MLNNLNIQNNILIYPKKNIIPIIIPETNFIDIYDDINNYKEMNSSMFIDTDGNITILVRCVNYNKYSLNEFVLYEDYSNSIYYTIEGNLNNNLDIENFKYEILTYSYNLDIYPSYWYGLEDIRFIDNNNILVTVPQLNTEGNPSIFKANFINNRIENFQSCYPNKIEKNWMPYFDNDNYKVIYSLYPFIIKSIENDDREELDYKNEILKNYHGSTNGVNLNNYDRLFLIHVNKDDMTLHRWLIYNIKSKDVNISEEFKFFKNSYIEFCCSLNIYINRFFITIGVNDNKSYIIETSYDQIIKLFPIKYSP